MIGTIMKNSSYFNFDFFAHIIVKKTVMKIPIARVILSIYNEFIFVKSLTFNLYKE